MGRINFHISLNTLWVLLALILLVFGLVIAINILIYERAPGELLADLDTYKVTRQSLYFEIDPERSLFLSRQVVTFNNPETSQRYFTFLIYPNLIIDRLDFKDDQDMLLELAEWRFGAPVQYPHGAGTVVLNQVQVHFANDLKPNQQLTLYLDVHLPRESFQTGQGGNLFELFVSAQAQYAVGFDSGAFAVINPSASAPLEIKIRHPESERCGIPGEQVANEPQGKFRTVTYRVSPMFEPAFSCTAYQIWRKNLEDVAVEFYLARDQAYSETMASIALQVFKQYRQFLGDPELHVFRFVFVTLNQDAAAADPENAGNTIYLSWDSGYENFAGSAARQTEFKILTGREELRLWVRLNGRETGSPTDWWLQGCAKFMSAWVGEMLWGSEFGRQVRAQYAGSLASSIPVTGRTPVSTKPASGKKNGQPEPALTAEYGALVWEQLRQRVGDASLIAGLREYFQNPPRHADTVTGLIEVLQRHTQVDLTAFLMQWTRSVAQIDLTVQQAGIQPAGSQFETQLTVQVNADQDYDFYTSLSALNEAQEVIASIPLHITQRGDSIVKFTSPVRPVSLHIDPEVRVPQTNTRNDITRVD